MIESILTSDVVVYGKVVMFLFFLLRLLGWFLDSWKVRWWNAVCIGKDSVG